jgi:hypothetical protein
MPKMSIIRSQSGSAILMALFGMMALAGAAYIVAQTMSNSDKVLQHDSRRGSYRELVTLVRNHLYAGNNCTLAIGRKSGLEPGVALFGALLPGGLMSGDDISLPITINGVSETLQPLWNRNGIKLKTIKLKIDGTARPQSVRIHNDLIPKTAAYATLAIVPENQSINILKQDASGKYEYEDLFIRLFVYYEEVAGEKRIYSCANPSGEAAFCTTALGGAYTHASDVSSELRCQPDLQCFQHKNGVVATGAPCALPYLSVPVGKTLQMCNWCHPVPLPGASVLTGFDSINENDLDFETEAGQEITCSAEGYSNLSPEEAYELRQEYEGMIPFLPPDQQAVYVECLSYLPPEPPPKNCFIAGTKIDLADGSERAIEEIKVGDVVLTYDEVKKKTIVRPVIEVFHHEKTEETLFTFTLSNGKTVTSNDIHPFYIQEREEYLSAQMIYESWRPEKSMSFLDSKERKVSILKIDKTLKKVPLYNLHIRGAYDTGKGQVNVNHNYFAEGVLVHNSKMIE